jgi:hypothetical protein
MNIDDLHRRRTWFALYAHVPLSFCIIATVVALLLFALQAAHAQHDPTDPNTIGYVCERFRSVPPDRNDPVDKAFIGVTYPQGDGTKNTLQPIGFSAQFDMTNGRTAEGLARSFNRNEQYRMTRIWQAHDGIYWRGVHRGNPRRTMVGWLQIRDNVRPIHANPRYIERAFINGRLVSVTTSAPCGWDDGEQD